MKLEEQNKKLYKDTFDEVHASENLLGKVKDMRKENINIVKRISKRAVCAAAAMAAVVFVSSNAIAYAATGSTWVEKVRLSVDGKTYTLTEKQADGTMVYEVDVPEAGSVSVESSEGAGENFTVTAGEATISIEGGRIYLITGKNGEKTDITDNFTDGVCEGYVYIDTGDEESGNYHYVATEIDAGDYSLEINKE